MHTKTHTTHKKKTHTQGLIPRESERYPLLNSCWSPCASCPLNTSTAMESGKETWEGGGKQKGKTVRWSVSIGRL